MYQSVSNQIKNFFVNFVYIYSHMHDDVWIYNINSRDFKVDRKLHNLISSRRVDSLQCLFSPKVVANILHMKRPVMATGSSFEFQFRTE